jgi:hypothetical protein
VYVIFTTLLAVIVFLHRDTGIMRITLDFDAFRDDPKTEELIEALQNNIACVDLMVLDDRTVPWFPREIADLDFVANRTLAAGADLQSDHPGFNDPVYRARRGELAQFAESYKAGHEIPRIEYTDVEVETWGKVYKYMAKLHKQYACQEYLNIVPLMEKHCGFSEHNIPQVQDISAFLKVSGAAPITVNILISCILMYCVVLCCVVLRVGPHWVHSASRCRPPLL